MKKTTFKFLAGFVMLALFGCSSGGGGGGGGGPALPVVNSVTLSKSSLGLKVGASDAITATVNGLNLTDKSVVWSSENDSIATVNNGKITAVAKGTTSIIASANANKSKNAKCTVTVTDSTDSPPPPPESSDNKIKASDTAIGFAADGRTDPSSWSTVTVSNRADFISNLTSSSSLIIYVEGEIDMSDGMLPSTAGGSTTKLDTFVKTVTTNLKAENSTKFPTVYNTYAEFKTAYAAGCSVATNDKKYKACESSLGNTLWGLNYAYRNQQAEEISSTTKIYYGKYYDSSWEGVVVTPKNNKVIIGKAGAVIKGGCLNISSRSNITIRNLTIQNAYDPFPHHEKNDGFNAEMDGIVVQGTSENIWIDHCTLQDTIWASTVTISGGGSEKWQTFDGLIDVKGSTKTTTISYCKIQDHDKTFLFGSSDTDGVQSNPDNLRRVTVCNNYFLNCGQRLPLVRNTNCHIYNNFFSVDSPHYSHLYAIGVRSGSRIIAEYNYFDSGVTKILGSDNNGGTYEGKYYVENNYYGVGSLTWYNGDKGSPERITDKSTLFTPAYTPEYITDVSTIPTENKANAGAGKWTVEQ